ncbi:MAG: Ig-like domain-containing protein [Prevotella sp.]|nr:Ig-like domain-containing protein [Prevotella sp.]
MKQHLLFNLRALLVLCMIFVIGGGSVALAAEGDEFYSLTAVTNKSNQVYATYYDVTINNLVWNVPGNQNFDGYWRIGGKSLTKIDRSITGKSPIGKAIGKVTLYHNGKSNANLTINSISLTVASDASFTDIIETVTKKSPNISVSTAGSIDFEPSNGAWAENSYYKLTINVSNSTKSNYGLDFTSMVFYEGATGSTTTVTFGEDVDDQTFDVNLGETFEGKTATVSPTEAGSVTYSSDNTEVASVNESTGAITIGNTAGKATITASFAATDTYLASSAKYYISVIDPNGPVFYESFNDNEGLGGNDGKWSGFSAQSTLKYDKSRWNVENGSGASRCVKIGTGDAKGTATTPAIDLSGDKYILTFKAGAWDATKEKTTIDVKISKGTLTYNGTSSSTQTITMNKAAWTDYTMTIAGATNSTTITFTAKDASNNRFFLDEVKIVEALEPATSTLSLVAVDNKIYYATFSSSKDVIFPSVVEVDAVSVEGSTLNMTELAKDDYFVKATSADGFDVVTKGYYVPANTGVLIKSLENSVTYYYPYEEATVTLPANQLKPAPAGGGTFAPEAGHVYYKLAYNNYDTKTGLGFYWGEENGGAFSVKAGTAYLAVPTTEVSGAKAFTLDGGVVTGISSVNVENNRTKTIYNIAGQRVYDMTKSGLYIVDGKKVVVK